MGKCTNCNSELDDGVNFCPDCGKKQSASGHTKSASESTAEISNTLKKMNDTKDSTSEFDNMDIENNKAISVLSYLSLLVIIPLIGAPKSRFARFHANQGLTLVILEIIWGIASAIIIGVSNAVFGALLLGFVADIISALLGLVNLAFVTLSIIGIINVVNGRAKQLPLIGNINLINLD